MRTDPLTTLILGAAVVCSGCGMYHSGRVSVPVAQAGGTVAERIPSIRFELQEAVVTVEARNYRRERERLAFVYVPTFPAAWFGMNEQSSELHRLHIKIEIKAKGNELDWWPSRMLHVGGDGTTNGPCRVVEGYHMYPDWHVEPIVVEPVRIAKPKSWWDVARKPFWVSFAVESDPREPFGLLLEGLEVEGRRVTIPKLEFREGRHNGHETFQLF